VVRILDGSVEVDISGRQAGRGAYFCRTRECWELGFKRGRLEHSLKIKLSQDNRERLSNWAQNYFEGEG